MNEETFRKIAYSRIFKLFGYFIASTLLTCVLYEISEWAFQSHGWRSQVVGLVFLLLSMPFGICAFIMGVSIWAWFSDFNRALHALKDFEHDPQFWRHHYKNVIGPITWK